MTSTTQKDAARRLGVHVNTVAHMLDDGRLTPVHSPHFQPHYSRHRHVDEASLKRLEASRA